MSVQEECVYNHRFELINLLRPRSQDVAIDVLGVPLGNICRWGGRIQRFYSVAEHLVRGLDLPEVKGVEWEWLHHDDHEALFGDMPTPEKRLLQPRWDELITPWDAMIADVYGLRTDAHTMERVKLADRKMLECERIALYSGEIPVGSHPMVHLIWAEDADVLSWGDRWQYEVSRRM